MVRETLHVVSTNRNGMGGAKRAKRGAGREIVTSVRMTREQYDTFRRLALQNERTMSGQMRYMLARLMEQERET